MLSAVPAEFSYVTRAEQTVRQLLSQEENRILARRTEAGELIGASVSCKNTVYLLCVDSRYRRHGLGSALLQETEALLRRAGYGSIQIGAGEDYLTPGVPVGVQPFREELGPEALPRELAGQNAAAFFEKRGYRHSWGEANCFDMEAELSLPERFSCAAGDTIDGITYRWAGAEDLPEVLRRVTAARRILWVFTARALFIRRKETGGGRSGKYGLRRDSCRRGNRGVPHGRLGCTVVSPAYRGRRIGTNPTLAGTKYLQETGLKRGFIGYTYSGLQKLYGRVGYRISAYYYMALKSLGGI